MCFEKNLAPIFEDCKTMLRVVERKKLILQVGHMLRFSTALKLLDVGLMREGWATY